jgi:hypothetical protein
MDFLSEPRGARFSTCGTATLVAEAGAAFLERNSPVNLVCCHLPFLVTLLRRSPPASSLARASTPETL